MGQGVGLNVSRVSLNDSSFFLLDRFMSCTALFTACQFRNKLTMEIYTVNR